MISEQLLEQIFTMVDEEEYLKGNIDINGIIDYSGNNLLSYVYSLEDIDYLISKGINIHHRNFTNENVLFGSDYLFFNKENKDNIMRKFFSMGINPNIINNDGAGILSDVYFFSYPEVYFENLNIINKDVLIPNLYINGMSNLIENLEKLKKEGFNIIFSTYITSEVSINKNKERKKVLTEAETESGKLKIKDFILYENMNKKYKVEMLKNELNEFILTLDILQYIEDHSSSLIYDNTNIITFNSQMKKNMISINDYYININNMIRELKREILLLSFRVV